MTKVRRIFKYIPAFLLVLIWLVFWATSFYKFRFVLANYFVIPVWGNLGLDFLHNHLGVNFWLAGGNPYAERFGDPRGLLYGYPPIVLFLYSWCGLLSLKAATILWPVAVAGIIGGVTAIALRLRGSVQFALPVALVLWSTPTLFAMERGNGDALVLAGILVAFYLYRLPRSFAGDLGIGALFAIVSWIKIYPLFLLFALIPVRRWRAFAFSIGALVLVGWLSRDSLGDWLLAMKQSQSVRVGILSSTIDWLAGRLPEGTPASTYPALEYISHSLSSSWSLLAGAWIGEKSWIARMPGLLASLLIFGFSLMVVGWRLLKSKELGANVVLAWWLWVATVGTFVMPLSYDYNMIYFPVLLMLLYDAQTLPRWLRGLFYMQFLWWCPIGILSSLKALMLVKLIGVFATGFVLYRHKLYIV